LPRAGGPGLQISIHPWAWDWRCNFASAIQRSQLSASVPQPQADESLEKGGAVQLLLVTRLNQQRSRAMPATWKPHEKQGRLTKRSDLPDTVFAYPKQRKEPMTNAAHVRNALARFDQVDGVTDADRSAAFANINRAAKHYGVDISEADWKALGRQPSTGQTKAKRKKAAAAGAATRKKRTARPKPSGATPRKKRAARPKPSGATPRKKRASNGKPSSGTTHKKRAA